MTLGSLVIALLLVVVLLQPFNQLAHKTFTLTSLLNPYMIGIVVTDRFIYGIHFGKLSGLLFIRV